jgi:molecular chaperone GrpE
LDDSIKQALIDRFRGYLDMVEDGEEPPDDPIIASSGETADLFSVLVEMAALRSEVRTESRLVKEALEQFRGVFDALQASQATLQRELDRARTEARDQAQSALRPLLLDVIDLRDRLVAALTLSTAAAARPRWRDRLWRRDRSGVAAWQEGLRMTLRRLDQVLLDRGVVATQLAGLPFDPRLARAIGTTAGSAVAEGTVIEEVRAGFLWGDQVLRTAEVIASKRDAGKGDR